MEIEPEPEPFVPEAIVHDPPMELDLLEHQFDNSNEEGFLDMDAEYPIDLLPLG